MSTTNLFVELIVIGVGALTWLSLQVLGFFGWEWVPIDQFFSTTALIPLISITYLLGILSDRIADTIFDRLWSRSLRMQKFESDHGYFSDRYEIMLRSDRLSDMIEYGRSRLRICRGWAFNAVLIAVALNVFIWQRPSDQIPGIRLSLAGSAASLAIAAAAWYCWRKLSVTEHQKVHEQASFLRRESISESGNDVAQDE